MPDCYMCLPTCDNCKPKMITCPTCGLPTLLDLPICPKCKQPWPQEAVDEVWRTWRIKKGLPEDGEASE